MYCNLLKVYCSNVMRPNVKNFHFYSQSLQWIKLFNFILICVCDLLHLYDAYIVAPSVSVLFSGRLLKQ